MENLASKYVTVPQAAKAFPKGVFREFLRFRRQGADEFFPDWRQASTKHAKIIALDFGVRFKALCN
jgi:hypothetical protein